jgi:uncharacterized protein YqjF (DUF2071 family)
MHPSLSETAHRPWPLPAGPWVMAQSWHDLLFAHWPIDAAQLRKTLRPHIPAALAIDTFNGQAWIGVVPFRMSGVRLRATPVLPVLSAFPELNVRTYVTHGGKPGVWFFSLDAANAIAVSIARAWFHLPYFNARMRCEDFSTIASLAKQAGVDREGWIDYESRRTHRNAPSANLRAKYRPTGKIFHAQPGTLEHFLTERYCLYAADGQGRVKRGEIHHVPWPLQQAEAKFSENTMVEAAINMECGAPAPLLLSSPHHPNAPLVHFSSRQDVIVWHPQPI